MRKERIALLTSGGLAPCLSASIGRLIKKYTEIIPNAEIIGYLNGYKGLLINNKIKITRNVRENAEMLYEIGGSVIGNSRVKLSNIEDCVKKGYVEEGQNPLDVAAERLIKDGITIIHTIGGDDTSLTASELAKHLKKRGHELTVTGLPKTVDNDIKPIRQTMGAWTAAEQGAIFFENIANENTTSSRQLIVHEVMGRRCGWLTAATAQKYRERLDKKKFLPDILLTKEKWDIDAVLIPEMEIDIDAETERLKELMDENDCVNIFISEGAGVESIEKKIEEEGGEVERDAFGHIKLDYINPGKWFAKRFTKMLKADKTLTQKSGYFARSAKANKKDLELIFKTADLAIESALNKKSGIVGLDEENNNELRCINFNRIKGKKKFNIEEEWFVNMLKDIGQI